MDWMRDELVPPLPAAATLITERISPHVRSHKRRDNTCAQVRPFGQHDRDEPSKESRPHVQPPPAGASSGSTTGIQSKLCWLGTPLSPVDQHSFYRAIYVLDYAYEWLGLHGYDISNSTPSGVDG